MLSFYRLFCSSSCQILSTACSGSAMALLLVVRRSWDLTVVPIVGKAIAYPKTRRTTRKGAWQVILHGFVQRPLDLRKPVAFAERKLLLGG